MEALEEQLVLAIINNRPGRYSTLGLVRRSIHYCGFIRMLAFELVKCFQTRSLVALFCPYFVESKRTLAIAFNKSLNSFAKPASFPDILCLRVTKICHSFYLLGAKRDASHQRISFDAGKAMCSLPTVGKSPISLGISTATGAKSRAGIPAFCVDDSDSYGLQEEESIATSGFSHGICSLFVRIFHIRALT